MKVRVEWNGGSIVLVRPLDKAARAWLEAHTDGQWFGGALACEPRYVEALLAGFAEAAS